MMLPSKVSLFRLGLKKYLLRMSTTAVTSAHMNRFEMVTSGAIKQVFLARVTGISYGKISQLLSGHQVAHPDDIRRLAGWCEIDESTVAEYLDGCVRRRLARTAARIDSGEQEASA